MPDGPGGFTQDSSCPALLRIPLPVMFLRVRAYHPLRETFPGLFRFEHSPDVAVLQPRRRLNGAGLGSSAFARHYLRNHFCFLLLGVLRCFSSPRSPPAMRDGMPSACRVAPFGNPRIKDYLHLPGAYRSLSRPSSPPRAKASALRSSLFFVSLSMNPRGFALVNCISLLSSPLTQSVKDHVPP